MIIFTICIMFRCLRSNILLLCFLSMLPAFSYAAITVRSQEDFDNLGMNIIKALDGDSYIVNVIIKPGTYYYKNSQFMLEGKIYPKVQLNIRGAGATILSSGADYLNGDIYNGQFRVDNAVVDGMNLLPVWSEMKYAEGKVEVVDENTHLCRVKCNGQKNRREYELKNSYIRIPQWFVMNTYKIRMIKDDYVYFVYKGLQKVENVGWNVNYDCYYGSTENVRYSLCNVVDDNKTIRISDGQVCLPEGFNKAHECTSYQFLTIKDCSFKSVNISGLNIVGNAWYMSYLVNLENVISDSFKIEDCSFSCMESDVVAIKSTPNVAIERCIFENCYRGCIFSDVNSQNTNINQCLFNKVGLDFENTSTVKCQGYNYSITNNTFRDYGYCAISLGYNRTRDEKQQVSGIAEYNRLEFTKPYVDQYKTSLLMDGGAIYVSTQNDKCVIRYNSINGHTGVKDNRGIFLDDGAYNVDIYGNVIINIPNSYCIDSRRVNGVESSGSRGSNVRMSNVNNKIYDNVVDGSIRFEAREGDNSGCELGTNYFLVKEGCPLPNNKYANLDTSNVETPIAIRALKDGKVFVQKKDYRKLKKSESWRNLRQMVRK